MTSTEITSAITRACREHGATGSAVVVGVSGGPDSATLLHLLAACANDLGLSLTVAHCDHGLRGAESAADADFVQALAQRYGLACIIESVDTETYRHSSGLGLEAAARELRYRFFADVAERTGSRFVITAHTRDDHAETVLMHLARGSGVRGLGGIPPARPLTPSVTVLRPLLAIPRADLHDVGRSLGLEWRIDSSNDDPTILRNRVRSILLPALREVFGPGVLGPIARTGHLLRSTDEALTAIATELAHACVNDQNGDVAFNIEALSTLPRAIAAEIVRHHVDAGHDDVERLLDLVSAEPGSMASLRGDRMAVRERDRITIAAEVSAEPTPAVVIDSDGAYVANSWTLSVHHRSADEVHPTPDTFVAYIDVRAVEGGLLWRAWEHGDRFRPFGMDGTVLVSDLLTNARIPHAERRSIRVVCDDVGILWVCGIRPAERTRVTASTRELLILTLKQ